MRASLLRVDANERGMDLKFLPPVVDVHPKPKPQPNRVPLSPPELEVTSPTVTTPRLNAVRDEDPQPRFAAAPERPFEHALSKANAKSVVRGTGADGEMPQRRQAR